MEYVYAPRKAFAQQEETPLKRAPPHTQRYPHHLRRFKRLRPEHSVTSGWHPRGRRNFSARSACSGSAMYLSRPTRECHPSQADRKARTHSHATRARCPCFRACFRFGCDNKQNKTNRKPIVATLLIHTPANREALLRAPRSLCPKGTNRADDEKRRRTRRQRQEFREARRRRCDRSRTDHNKNNNKKSKTSSRRTEASASELLCLHLTDPMYQSAAYLFDSRERQAGAK